MQITAISRIKIDDVAQIVEEKKKLNGSGWLG